MCVACLSVSAVRKKGNYGLFVFPECVCVHACIFAWHCFVCPRLCCSDLPLSWSLAGSCCGGWIWVWVVFRPAYPCAFCCSCAAETRRSTISKLTSICCTTAVQLWKLSAELIMAAHRMWLRCAGITSRYFLLLLTPLSGCSSRPPGIVDVYVTPVECI